MTLPSPLRLRRRLAFPFVVVLYVLLWLGLRETGVFSRGQSITDPLPGVLALVAGALVVSYVVAVAVAAAFVPETGSAPWWARGVIEPTNATLVVIGAITVGLAASIVVEAEGIRVWIGLAPYVRAVALVLAWPLYVVLVVMFAAGNAASPAGLPDLAKRSLLALGVGLTAAWLFVLSSWIAAVVSTVVSLATDRLAR